MDREELYKLLDIEMPEDFRYFENMAELMETPAELNEDLLAELFLDLDMDLIEELLNSYFEELQRFIPDEETDLYILTENMKRCLTGLAHEISAEENAGEKEHLVSQFTEEIGKFRVWYVFSENVEVSGTGGEREVTMLDALCMIREEKYGGETCSFDFSGALDYELSEYVMTLDEQNDFPEES